MKPYSSVISPRALGYIWFTGTQVLGQFGETGPENPKPRARIREK